MTLKSGRDAEKEGFPPVRMAWEPVTRERRLTGTVHFSVLGALLRVSHVVTNPSSQ